MFDVTKAVEGSEKAVADVRAKADVITALNLKMADIQRRRQIAEDEQDLRTLVKLLPEAEDTARNIVYADADYQKAVQVASIVRAAAEMKAKAGQLRSEGKSQEGAQWDLGAEKLATTLKTLSEKKMTVKLPTRTKLSAEIEKLAQESGGMEQLAGLDDLAFWSSVKKAVKKVVKAPVNAVKSVGKAIGKAAESAAKFAVNNAPLVLGAVGTVVGSVVPGIGTAAGAAVGSAVGGLVRAAAAKIQQQVPQPPPPSAVASMSMPVTSLPPQQNFAPQSAMPLPYVPPTTTMPPAYPTTPDFSKAAGMPASTGLPANAPLFNTASVVKTPTVPQTAYGIPASAAPPQPSSNTPLLIAGGVGALALLGVAVVMKRKRS